MSKNSNDLFDWYSTKSMKEIMPQKDKYDYSSTGIEPNSRILCVGTTGSGKTQALLHYLRLSPNLFSRIIVFYKEREHMYDLLDKAFKGRIEFHDDLAELEKLKDLRKDMDEDERILIVLDDWVMELKNYKNINDYFIYGRKKEITIFILSQDYYRIPKVIRNQMTYLLLFRMTQQKDIKLVLSEYDNKEKELLPIYKNIISKPLNFMKIETRCCEKNTKISRNFTEYIDFE